MIDRIEAIVRAWRPPVPPPVQHPRECCPVCGSFAWSYSKAEKRHHVRVHAGEAELCKKFPGLLTSYNDREAVTQAGPPDDASPEEWVMYALDVLWALFSRSAREWHLGVSGKLLKVPKPHPFWLDYAHTRLTEYADADRRERPFDPRIRYAARKVPRLLDPRFIERVPSLLGATGQGD
jgi:hypothetical protein